MVDADGRSKKLSNFMRGAINIMNNSYSIESINNEKQRLSFRIMKKYERSGLKKNEALNILKVLIDYMKENKPYLKSDLTISNLSKEIYIPKHYISQVINEKLNKNFNTFINEYRVKEFKQRLVNPTNAHFTIIALAFESGFNSKTSFNMIFKKIEKVTPSEFRKSILIKKKAGLNK